MARKRYAVIIGIILFVFILLNLNISEVAGVVLNADPLLLALAVLVALLSGAAKGLRWHIIIRAHSLHLSFASCVKYFFIGFFISILTPGRVGDLVRAAYMRKHGASMAGALPTVVVDRLMDVAFLFALGSASVLFFALVFGVEIVPLYILLPLLAAFAALALVMLKRNFTGLVLKPFFNAFVPERHKEKLRLSFGRFYDSLREAKGRKKLILAAALLTALVWLLSVLLSYLLLLALHITGVPFYYLFVLIPILALLDLLPVSISGLGTREAGAIALLSVYGITAEHAVAFSLSLLAVGYLVTAAIGALLFVREPVEFKLFSEADSGV